MRWLLADAFARRGDWMAAREMAASVPERHRDSRLAPRALLVAAWAASRAGDEAGAQTMLTRLIAEYPLKTAEYVLLASRPVKSDAARSLPART